jgi:HPt (histidine-containing phosphotransfer) domain-containing protein
MDGATPSQIDKQAILERVDNDHDLLKQLIEIFIKKTPEYLEQLQQSVQSKNAEQTRFFAHTLKGSLANFGAEKARQMAFEIETMGKDNALNNAPQALQALEIEIQGVVQAILEFRNEL